MAETLAAFGRQWNFIVNRSRRRRGLFLERQILLAPQDASANRFMGGEPMNPATNTFAGES
jgi:hypothetical protein